MHQNIPLSSVTMSRLSGGSRTAASRRRTDNAVSARHESHRDALLDWLQTHEAEGAPVERLHIVVAELCRALSNALRDEREAAQECSDETPSDFRRSNRGGS
jgi:hypothetical protein